MCKVDYMDVVCYGNMPIEKTYFIEGKEYNVKSFDGIYYEIFNEFYEIQRIYKNDASEYFLLRDELIDIIIK